ncbi:MAG: hypothetical protein ABWY78_17240 [Microvirga sp.]
MARPTTAEFVYSAGWTYTQGSVAPKNPFLVEGKQLTALDVDAGFFGAAFLTPAGQVIVAFEGTDIDDFSGGPSDRAFAAAQILADIQIYLGQEPPAYAQAMAFTQAVVQAAAKQGITRDNVFVTGHSLGGGVAGYVAAQTGLGAETYGAPGVPRDTVPGNGGPGVVNYVEWGDPVGNYSASPSFEGNILYSTDIVRYGSPNYIGPFEGAFLLSSANALFAPGSSTEENVAGIGLFATAAYKYHLLVHYAAALGVPYDPAFSEIGALSAGDVERLISNLLEGPATFDAIRFAWDDTLTGTAGRNTLRGYAGNDHLAGGAGADRLHGGTGVDRFVYKAVTDSTIAAAGRDTIFDFSHAERDRIDLRSIDARIGLAGNQAFKFIGSAEFHDRAGELRFERVAGGAVVSGDVNGDGVPDFAIAMKGITQLVKGDFIL